MDSHQEQEAPKTPEKQIMSATLDDVPEGRSGKEQYSKMETRVREKNMHKAESEATEKTQDPCSKDSYKESATKMASDA